MSWNLFELILLVDISTSRPSTIPPVFGAMDEDLDASQGAEAWPKVGGDGEEMNGNNGNGRLQIHAYFFFARGWDAV